MSTMADIEMPKARPPPPNAEVTAADIGITATVATRRMARTTREPEEIAFADQVNCDQVSQIMRNNIVALATPSRSCS